MNNIQGIFKKVQSFVNETDAVRIPLVVGCVTTGVVAANYVFDKLYRVINEYPPGPTGLKYAQFGCFPHSQLPQKKDCYNYICCESIGLPFLGCVVSMGLNQSKFWDNLGSNFAISMVYFFRKRAVILSDPDLINYIFKHNSNLFPFVNDRMPPPKSRAVPKEEVPLISKMFHDWPARRQLVVKALQRVLNHKYIDNIISNIFETILYKQILSNTNNLTNSWKSINDDLRYFQFYLLFYSIFGNINYKHNKSTNNNTNTNTDSNYTSNMSNININDDNDDAHDDTQVRSRQQGRINIAEPTLKKYGAIMMDCVTKVIEAGTTSQILMLMGLEFLVTKERDEVRKIMKKFDDEFLKWINKHTKFGPNITDDINVIDNDKYGQVIENIKKLLSMQENGPSFILDTLIDAMVNKEKYCQSGGKKLGQMNMKSILSEISILFAAGMETTSTSMEFIIVQLAKRIKIQNEVYNELMNHLKENNIIISNGANGCKTIDTSKIDFTKLNLLRAFFWECLRVSSVVVTGVPHVCNKRIDIQFKNNKYVIPKGSILMFNSLYVNTSGKYWNNNVTGHDRNNIDDTNDDNTDIFNLGHWLNKESGKFEMNNNFVGFGTGRRDCVGKRLAIDILRRLMVLFLINFKVYGPNGVTNDDVDQSIQTKFKVSITRNIDPPIPVTLQPRSI